MTSTSSSALLSSCPERPPHEPRVKVNEKLAIARRSGNFHPTVWGDFFINLSSDETKFDASTRQQILELKQEVGRMLNRAADDQPLLQMKLIDLIQCSGTAYHFEMEIEKALRRINESRPCENDDHLHAVALQFRLLRQHGYHVSSDVFSKFKNEEGKFTITGSQHVGSGDADTQAMLSLYEAAHLSFHGEEILAEALDFSKKHLTSVLPHVDSPVLASQVRLALELPLYHTPPRLRTRKYLSILSEHEQEDSYLSTDQLLAKVIKLAKLDFNLLQAMHREELQAISRWWKKMDVPTKLPFARDRVVEGYYWVHAVSFQPHYSRGRNILTKIISLSSIIDDIYDVHGTLEELQLFTDAIQSWDKKASDELPEYMKQTYLVLLETMEHIDKELELEGLSYRTQYLKETIKSLTSAYLKEAQWFFSDYVPTVEEYMSVALVTSAYQVLTVASFVGMDEVATKEVFDWAMGNPKIIKAASTVCRLLDDIHSHKAEQERGHVASCVECYMKEFGSTEEETCVKLREMATSAWKDINEECQRSTTKIHASLLERVLNLVRVMETMYKTHDGYTDSRGETRDYIKLVLIDPLAV
ncbi:hypothetical protein H6P81_001683 [Aristolochia fimbriata]|uniref:Uncharacterized protein n=1 Tax=Aristolochia fimbriata TaxID=158543 RepID=A0AAV7F7L7_ARIFI|nr:hypothetical protein H6P81_001683 [Aristolochia fimbriata]